MDRPPRLPGIANVVTGSRGVLAVPAFFFSLHASAFGALAATVAVAGATDLLDGAIARRFDRPTKLGAGLDPVVDGIFYGAVAVGLAIGGAYPLWLALVVVARYVVPALVGGVLVLRGTLPALRHTFFGQLSTSLMAVLLGGLALFRGIGLDGSAIVTAMVVVFPLVTVLAWVELARTAVDLSRPR